MIINAYPATRRSNPRPPKPALLQSKKDGSYFWGSRGTRERKRLTKGGHLLASLPAPNGAAYGRAFWRILH